MRCATACSGGGSEQPTSKVAAKAATACFFARLRSERITEPPCPPEPVVYVRDEALAIVAPGRVEFLRDLGGDHLLDAAALTHQVLDALAHDGQHLELSLKMRARLRRSARRHDQRVGVR